MVEAQSGEKDKVEVEQKDNKCSTKGWVQGFSCKCFEERGELALG